MTVGSGSTTTRDPILVRYTLILHRLAAGLSIQKFSYSRAEEIFVIMEVTRKILMLHG